jgi:hypothetical protein
MPYDTKKMKGGVMNVNKKTGKATSKKPMTKANAEKQKKAIAMSEKKKIKLKVVPRKNKEELRKALEDNKKLGASMNFNSYMRDYMNNQPVAKTEKQMEKLSAKADKEVFKQMFKYYSDKGTLSGFKLK